MTEHEYAGKDGDAARHWWRKLEHDGAARAQLRRCRTAIEAATIPVTLDLARSIGSGPSSPREQFVHACELARVLAWVDREGRIPTGPTMPLMRTLGWPKFPDKNDTSANRPLLSEVRFRRLLRTDEPADLADQLVRLIRQADRMCQVRSLAADFLAWCDPARAPGVKQAWAYAYYNADSTPNLPAEEPTA